MSEKWGTWDMLETLEDDLQQVRRAFAVRPDDRWDADAFVTQLKLMEYRLQRLLARWDTE